jgi:hypothetical protein
VEELARTLLPLAATAPALATPPKLLQYVISKLRATVIRLEARRDLADDDQLSEEELARASYLLLVHGEVQVF